MTFLRPTLAFATAFSTALILSTALISTAYAEPTGYNQLTFNSEVKTTVDNDEVRAVLYKKAQANNAKALATILNNAINDTLSIAKRYPSVTVHTGQQSTYPRYDKNQKIIGWTGQVNLNLKSTDLTAASQLIADLQETLVMENLSFGISQDKQDKLKQQLRIQASKAFQQQAQTLSRAWDATGYRIIQVNLDTGSRYPYPVDISAPMAMRAPVVESSAPIQNFEAGSSTISVTANGTIELVK